MPKTQTQQEAAKAALSELSSADYAKARAAAVQAADKGKPMEPLQKASTLDPQQYAKMLARIRSGRYS